MKSLNINIPTTVQFIRKIAKFWVLVLLLLISLLYTYFWLNSVDENILNFDFESSYAEYDNVKIKVDLNVMGKKLPNYQLPSGNIIEVNACGVIHDSTEIDSIVFRMIKSQWDKIKLSESYKKLFDAKKKQIDYSINKASVRYDIATNKDIEYLYDRLKSYKASSYKTIDSLNIKGGGRHLTYFNKDKGDCWFITEYSQKGYQYASSEYILNWSRTKSDETNRFRICQYFNSNFFETIRSKNLTRIYLSINNSRFMRDNFKGNYELNIDTYDSPLSIISIYPQPDKLTTNNIVYNDPDKLEILSNQGILIYGESIRKKDIVEKMNFILASFIGVLFSILAEIGVKHFGGRSRKNE